MNMYFRSGNTYYENYTIMKTDLQHKKYNIKAKSKNQPAVDEISAKISAIHPTNTHFADNYNKQCEN